MTKDETIEFLEKCAERNEKGECENCPGYDPFDEPPYSAACALRYLRADPAKVPRIEKIHTVRELADAADELERHCGDIIDCAECTYYSGDGGKMFGCLLKFLREPVKK